MPGPQICIGGLIGAGKSTAAIQLGKALDLPVYHEPVKGNPFLEIFYKEPKEWAGWMQFYLLLERYKIHMQAGYEALCRHGSIVDRSLIEDRAFCKLHVRKGNIDPLVWEHVYEPNFNFFLGTMLVPQVLIFLDVEPQVALERIQKRNRGAESGITLDYLQDLQKEYYDLFSLIESGEHSWSRGMTPKRLQWNVDYQGVEDMVKFLHHEFPELTAKRNDKTDP